MKPGICMVLDGQSERAQASVADMLEQLGVVKPHEDEDVIGENIVTGAGAGWAAAVIAPPSNEPTAGASIHTDSRNILIWTGEMFLPDAWTEGVRGERWQKTISISLLRRLNSFGVNALAEVDGTFCGAWYDGRKRRWMIFNDKIGFLPVFWASCGNRLIIGPKAWVTAQIADLPMAISDVGVTNLIRTQNAVDDHTLIEGVHWLVGGHAIIHDVTDRTDGLIHKYWELRHRPQKQLSVNELVDSYVEALKRTLHRYTACRSPLMLGISGGMDSRMLLAGCHAIDRAPSCFTTGVPFGDDVRFGRRLARVAGASHTYVPLETQGLFDRVVRSIIETDGLHGAAHLLHGSCVPEFLAKHAGSVLLEGLMNGVAGGGCVAADDDIDEAHPPHQSHWARSRLHSGGDIDLINKLLRSEYASASYDRWKARIDDKYHQAPADDPLSRAEYTSQSGRSGQNNVLGPMLLRRDVLVRHPLCSRFMAEWFASTPPRLRRGKQIHMEIIRRRFPAFARVQRTNYNGLPIAEDRWLRERCWQRERIHRWWTHLRYPRTRTLGMDAQSVRALAFDTWRRNGDLSVLVESDARILNWFDRRELASLWNSAVLNPRQAVPLLTLATIEITVRWLEQLKRRDRISEPHRVPFRWFDQTGPISPKPAPAPTLSEELVTS